MKNAYPDSAIASPSNAVSPALFYFFSGSAVLSLVLRLCNLIQDSRVLWASLILFTASVLLHQRSRFHRPSARTAPPEAYANSADTGLNPVAIVPTPELEKTVDRETFILKQQQGSRFMTPEEFRGEVALPHRTPTSSAIAPGTHITAEALAPFLEAHLVWLERGALPDASGRAVLIRADFAQEDLRGAILARANLTQTQWTGALLSDANLSGATLCHSDLSQTDLRGIDCRETDLRECHLIGIDGRGADMRGAELIQAKLNGANLSGADLSEAYLSGADLTGVDLSGARLDGAYLSGALLLGADLTGSSLEGIDLRRARYDTATRWPARFEPRSCGAILSTESSNGEAVAG